MQTAFGDLMRLLILIGFTFAAAAFGSFWIWGLLGSLTWTIVAMVRSNLRMA